MAWLHDSVGYIWHAGFRLKPNVLKTTFNWHPKHFFPSKIRKNRNFKFNTSLRISTIFGAKFEKRNGAIWLSDFFWTFFLGFIFDSAENSSFPRFRRPETPYLKIIFFTCKWGSGMVFLEDSSSNRTVLYLSLASSKSILYWLRRSSAALVFAFST